MKKLTRAQAVAIMTLHRPDYDYSLFEYNGSTVKSIVKCHKHGEFSTSYDKIKGKHGCPHCKNELTGKRCALSQEEAVDRMMSKRPEYDFSKFEYRGSQVKGIVLCPTHGEFVAHYANIIGGHGCPKCKSDVVAKVRTIDSATAIATLKIRYPDYDFSKIEYVNTTTKFHVWCAKHGFFETSYKSLMSGRKCPACGIDSRTAMRTLNCNVAISRMQESLPEYDYSEFEYKGAGKKSTVLCSRHGVFKTTYVSIVAGVGCAKCASERAAETSRIPFNQFETRAHAVHGDEYEYKEDSYTGVSGKVIAVCPIHGEFIIRCAEHIGGQKCPDCKDTHFNPKKMAYLYLGKVTTEKGVFLGYGITANLARRTEEHKKRLAAANASYELVDSFKFKRGYACRDTENQLKSQLETVNLNVRGFKREATYWENLEVARSIAHEMHCKYGKSNDLCFH